MDEKNLLAERFEAHRHHLGAVAYRMLGSRNEAEDAVQEAWLRISRSDTGDIANLGGWLTTVVARICLDMLSSRRSRREEPLDAGAQRPTPSGETGLDPEQEAILAESVGLALLVVLQKLAPAERVAFVLHDMFNVPFENIASVVGRSPTAARQLASRARRRVSGGAATVADADRARQRQVLEAFLAASRNSDFTALLAVLDPDVVSRSDDAAVRLGGASEVRGAANVARSFMGRAQAARPAIIDGALGVVVAPNGRLMLVLDIVIRGAGSSSSARSPTRSTSAGSIWPSSTGDAVDLRPSRVCLRCNKDLRRPSA
jgi:RNA polymerase sigma-70 factor (ECF subfamily)